MKELKKTKLNIILLTLVGLFLIVSCKKSKNTDDSGKGTCTDGYLNNGEEHIDCGGPCKPCETTNVSTLSAYYQSPNFTPGALISFATPAVSHVGGWVISGSVDTINISLDFGPSMTEGTHAIVGGAYTKALVNGESYDVLVGTSSFTITHNDTVSKLISGTFTLHLQGATFYPTDTIYDVLNITGGDFESLQYN